MTTNLVQLTPFEAEVLNVIGDYIHVNHVFTDASLFFHGQHLHLYGSHWGGSTVQTEEGYTYPLINRFLGRLRAKGIVQRKTSSMAMVEGTTWGVWSLTDSGKLLLGIR